MWPGRAALQAFNAAAPCSHAVEKDGLRAHLAPLVSSRQLAISYENEGEPGWTWPKRILDAVSKAGVIVLLVSPDYLASRFIVGGELPLAVRAGEERGARIIPVNVRPSLFVETDLGRYQAANVEPLSGLPPSKQDEVLVNVARKIAEAAGRSY